MQVKVIKRGKSLELLEDINLPEGEEVLINVEEKTGFWKSLEKFRHEEDIESAEIDEAIFEGLRD